MSLARQKALAIIPKINGSFSCILSTIIVVTVLRDKKRRSATYHRLIMCSSIIDMLTSFWTALSTWPFPRESGRLWAVGTTQTCTAQGFFLQLSLVSAAYNASLCVYYILTIVESWKPHQVNRVEPYLHAVPVFFGLAFAIAALPLNLYNPSISWCFIAKLPFGCEKDACIRGLNANIYVWAFFYGPVWIMIFVITASVTWVYLHVRKIEKASAAYKFRGAAERRRSVQNLKRTRQVAKQCFGYAAGFYICWVPVTVLRLKFEVAQPLALLAISLQPLPFQYKAYQTLSSTCIHGIAKPFKSILLSVCGADSEQRLVREW